MSQLVISSFTLQPQTTISGATCKIRLWYNRSFLDSTGQQVQPGSGTTGFRIVGNCTIAGGVITVPALTLYTTDNALDSSPSSISLSAAIFTDSGSFVQQITIGSKTQFVVPSSLAPTTTWEFFSEYNQSVVLANPPLFFYTAPQVDALIAAVQSGDVTGPVSSTDNAIVRWDGVGGSIIQDSGITIADGASGTLSGTNTGDQTITLTGDVTGSGTGSIATTITTPGAPSNATYITQTASGGLSAEQALSALATGLVKNTTTTGVLSIAGAGTDYISPTTETAIIQVACSDETTALTTGTAKVTFRMPKAMTVTAVRGSLTTAQASGSIFTVDVNEGGVSILSTKLTIDNTELTSTTAATPPVISDSALADDASITVDIDQVGDGSAKGLKVSLIGTWA